MNNWVGHSRNSAVPSGFVFISHESGHCQKESKKKKQSPVRPEPYRQFLATQAHNCIPRAARARSAGRAGAPASAGAARRRSKSTHAK